MPEHTLEPTRADYQTRITQLTVLPKGEPIFHEGATRITITDEAAGEFVEVTQCCDADSDQTIRLDPEEWPAVRAAVNTLMEHIADHANE